MILTGLFILLLSGAALAGYARTALLGGYTATAARDFYFTSDLLKDGPDIPAYDLYHDWSSDGAATIRLKLRNYESLLNISGSDIAYTVTPSGAGGAVEGVLPAGGAEGREENVTLSVPAPADTGAPLEVTVTATSASPYEKTLAGRFVIHPALAYTVDENAGAPVAVLTVTTAPGTETAKNVTISWPAGASPDMTSPLVTSAAALDLKGRTMTVALSTAGVTRLVFFKDSSAGDYAGITVAAWQEPR